MCRVIKVVRLPKIWCTITTLPKEKNQEQQWRSGTYTRHVG